MKDYFGKKFANKKQEIVCFRGLCKGCGLCIEKCPVKAITFSKAELGYLGTPSVNIDINKCIACGICELICPDSALKLKKN